MKNKERTETMKGERVQNKIVFELVVKLSKQIMGKAKSKTGLLAAWPQVLLYYSYLHSQAVLTVRGQFVVLSIC